jgi:formylglycine-generating enzyme required for sulfatase activity
MRRTERRREGMNQRLRGGSWGNISQNLRSTYHVRCDPTVRNDDFGFRCVTVNEAPAEKKRPAWYVLRGGSWDSDPQFLRSINRFRLDPMEHDSSFGFRCAVPGDGEKR